MRAWVTLRSEFIEDVVAATDTLEELLEQILKELIKHNLTIEPSKTQICKQKIEFQGFKINKYGYSNIRQKVAKN